MCDFEVRDVARIAEAEAKVRAAVRALAGIKATFKRLAILPAWGCERKPNEQSGTWRRALVRYAEPASGSTMASTVAPVAAIDTESRRGTIDQPLPGTRPPLPSLAGTVCRKYPALTTA